ncbi:MAG: glycosyltransferase family 2 protein [Thermodesulfovibrionales bacterium]|nr:glycosyltransferase family 2 protein [Thermodesulfovibrionales bacterium]
MANNPFFSVVIPVFNSKESLVELHRTLCETFRLMDKTFELIFVNDCSHDGSLAVLQEIKKNDQRIVVIDLYRNFGQQNALLCGFNYCKGEYVITIDDDLQNPPQEIAKLYQKICEGYDAVFASYGKKKDKIYKNLGSFLIRKLTQKIFNIKNDLRFSSFRIIRQAIVEELRLKKTPYPYISGMILNITRQVANVEVEHQKRRFGRSNYTFRKLVKLAFNLLINYSTYPLKIISFGGIVISIAAFSMGIFVFIRKLMMGSVRTGWTSTVMLISFFASMFFLIAFIFGEYLKRILAEVEKNKQYSVKTVYRPESADDPKP